MLSKGLLYALFAASVAIDGADACSVLKEVSFLGERVRLVRGVGLPNDSEFAVFRAPLAVNTDGAPNSYHPYDFLGQNKSINRIDNGVVIKKADGAKLSTNQKKEIFEQWRDSDWNVPAGYSINWGNVIEQHKGKPCVFKSGEYKGYFGSLTALKNGISPSLAGECNVKNQLDQRFIPAIALRGRLNPLRGYGVSVGDLVVVLNPLNGNLVGAVVGDLGDGKRIGEGSVALNKALLGKDALPSNYSEAKALDTGLHDMIVAVIPKSRIFERVRPYTPENINMRVDRWISDNGYGDMKKFKNTLLSCSSDI